MTDHMNMTDYEVHAVTRGSGQDAVIQVAWQTQNAAGQLPAPIQTVPYIINQLQALLDWVAEDEETP